MNDDRSDALFELADIVLAVARHIEAAKPRGHSDASPLHGAVLRHVDRNPGATVSDVAEATRMLSSNVSRAVRNLVDEDYLSRVPDESDGRRVRLYPTTKAAENRADLRSRWSQLLGRTDLDLAEAKALTIALRTVETELGRTQY